MLLALTQPLCVLQVAKAVSHSLNNCVNCLPGQKDVDLALKSIGEASKKLLIETVSLFCGSPESSANTITIMCFSLKKTSASNKKNKPSRTVLRLMTHLC